MLPPASLRRASLPALLLFAASCATRSRAIDSPPATDFVVTAGDSAFWVSTSDGRLHVRRAPLTLANLNGKFYELYVADDDRSYYDALLIGQRIFRRDLASGDSVQIYEDHRVSKIARAYAAAHPRERPLGDDEDGSEDPHTVATSDAELLDVVGPLLSFSHVTDIEITNGEDSHTIHHGVVDLRDGSVATLRGVFGDTAAQRIIRDGRNAYAVVRDSVRRSRSANARRAARLIDTFRFDSTSFVIADVDGAPTVGFYVPGRDASGEAVAMPLPSTRAPAPSWWSEIVSSMPRLGADSSSEIWHGSRYDVIARYDSSGEFATLVVRDSSRHEWSAGALPVPARRLFRLDVPAVDTVQRRALARAFDESTLYSGSGRTVRGPARHAAQPRLVLTHWTRRPAGSLRASPRPASRHLDYH